MPRRKRVIDDNRSIPFHQTTEHAATPDPSFERKRVRWHGPGSQTDEEDEPTTDHTSIDQVT